MEKYDFEIKRHAFIQALKRGITPDMIEATLKGGRMKKFGKNNAKFYKKYRIGTVICVDEIIGTKIKIVTVEVKK